MHNLRTTLQQDWSTFINIFAAERVPTRVIEMIETGYVSTMRGHFSEVRKLKKETPDLKAAETEAKIQVDMAENLSKYIDDKELEMERMEPEGDNGEFTEEQKQTRETLTLELETLREEQTRVEPEIRVLKEAYETAHTKYEGHLANIRTAKATAEERFKSFFVGDTRFATVGSARRNTN